MQLIRLGTTLDIGKNRDFYYIADHTNFKIYKLKNNPEIEFIIENISITKKESLINEAIVKGFDKKNISYLLNKLMEIGVIEHINFPDDTDIDMLQSYKMPEAYFSERFGLQIAAFKEYENDDINRFEIQQKIRNSEITIIGLGGVGSNIAVMAAAIGVKKLRLIDNDYVEMGNLVRQIFYRETDCNKVKKVNALKRFINNFTSYTKVETVEAFISNEEAAYKHLVNDSLVIQTADKPKGYIDWIINKACVKRKIPVIFTHNNSVGPFYVPGKSACFECFKKYLDNDSNGLYSTMIENLDENVGSIYPAIVTGPWSLSYYLFEEILRYIIGVDKPITMNSFMDTKASKLKVTPFKKQTGCVCCGI
ncbi:ThiF family adenylyltransferase [Clostridiaceae bacterium M8S5]|nr:ThiF family adenylyltransferase [Clostridiaceae bacterium M8S5]